MTSLKMMGDNALCRDRLFEAGRGGDVDVCEGLALLEANHREASQTDSYPPMKDSDFGPGAITTTSNQGC